MKKFRILHEAWNPTPAQEKELQKLIDWVDEGPPAKEFIAKMNKLIDSVKGLTSAENKAIKKMTLDQVKAHLDAWGSDMDESRDPFVNDIMDALSHKSSYVQEAYASDGRPDAPFFKVIKDCVDLARTRHPSERIQIATAILNSAARDKDTPSQTREKIQKFEQQLDRLADAW